ncbi:dihydrofolate reductase family protein [Actinomadura sp. 21ATH]|uniref:dihydrofolate reductase family protein n=1 Tax=Actinomadura sp. 21ATH TaxID=1735444 RepID=UPI0035BEB58B
MYVVAHVAVSIDGATTGFNPDMRRFYELASTYREDVTLVGADTILAQEEALATAPQPGPAPSGPLLAVVDGRGRVSQWEPLRNAGHWSDVLALHTETTPPRPRDRSVRELVTGQEHVDLADAINTLGRVHGAQVIRVDSGGALIGALLKGRLLDEVSLLVHPCLAGAHARRFWYGREPASVADLELLTSESFDGGLVRLRYRISPEK